MNQYPTNWPNGQVAFITGAASGIGLGIARALVAAGAKVALADIDAERLSKVEAELTSAGGTVLAVPFDVSEADQWTSAADKVEKALGPVSILCNIAGVNGGGLIDKTPLDVWRWVYKVNIESQFVAVSTFLPKMKQQGGRAYILNTASVAGIIPMTPVAAYSSSKFASVGFTMVLRDELKNTNVGVSLLIPGSVATRINYTATAGEAKLLGHEQKAESTFKDESLLAKGANPDEVGKQVVEAMQKDQFMIVTHREWEQLVKPIHSEIEAAFKDFDGRHGVDPTAEVMLTGINPIAN